ncbi:MAG TPA: mechanosensitive ion channel domain-containing protein [Rhizomicrobium sp.]|nr:mechanosensitive ion channel domain-containing protein [Rhizomicrobium sp.]
MPSGGVLLASAAQLGLANFFVGSSLIFPIAILFLGLNFRSAQRGLDPARLAPIADVISAWKTPAVLALIASAAILLGFIYFDASLAGTAKPIFLAVVYALYVSSCLIMLSINPAQLRFATNFMQWCDRQKEFVLNNSDFGDLNLAYRRSVLDRAPIVPAPALYREYFQRERKEGRIAVSDLRMVLGEHESDVRRGEFVASNAARPIRIALLVAFVVLATVTPVMHIYALSENKGVGVNSGATVVVSNSLRDTLDLLFYNPPQDSLELHQQGDVAKINIPKRGGPSDDLRSHPLYLFYRFCFLFLLVLPPLRYFTLIGQFELLNRRGGKSGLGLESDAVSKMSASGVLIVSVLLALMLMNVSFASLGLLTGLVAAGLSIALRDTLGNLMAGMQIVWDGSVKKGDVISIPTAESRDTGSTYGIVQQVRMRYTVVEDRNTVRRLIPNYLLTSAPIESWTHEDNRVRLGLRIGVAYGSDLRLVQKIMESVCYDVPRVLTEKPPQALLVEYSDSALVFSLRFWLPDPSEGIRPVISEILINLYDRFDEEGIVIPYPQRDLHIKSISRSDTRFFREELLGTDP